MNRRNSAPRQQQPVHGIRTSLDIQRWCQRFKVELPPDRPRALYALPPKLLDALELHGVEMLSHNDLELERELSRLCGTDCAGVLVRRWSSSSIFEGAFIAAGLLDRSSPLPVVTREDVESLGWDQDAEQINAALQEAEALMKPLRNLAYLGWLLTNPTFVRERDELRDRRMQEGNLDSFVLRPEKDDEPFRQFLNKWQLSWMHSWELPAPQGPNLSSVPWPGSVASNMATVDLKIPVTTGLRSDYPLHQVVADQRMAQTPEHLRPWTDTLHRKGDGVGLIRYERIFHVHFYECAIRERYHLARGMVKGLERALAMFLSISHDQVKKLRRQIRQRLAG